MAWPMLAGRALKYTPIALEAARQLDHQLRPHLLAYGAARDVDGFVARWTATDGVHWVVFPDRQARPLRAFPPLPEAELHVIDEQLDRGTLKHHQELPEARVKQTGSKLVNVPSKLVQRRRADD